METTTPTLTDADYNAWFGAWVHKGNEGDHIIETMIQKGIDVNATRNIVLDHARTLLHEVAAFGRYHRVVRLLEAGADVNFGDGSYYGTPLVYATENDDNASVIKLLIDSGASLKATDSDGNTALHNAALFKNIKVVDMLLNAGADVMAKNNDGGTPLHKAAGDGLDFLPAHRWREFGDVKVIDTLVKAGADLMAKDNEGETPLHKAVKVGLVEVIDALLKAGADPMAKNYENETPLHKAAGDELAQLVPAPDWVVFGDVNVVGALLKAGSDLMAKNYAEETPLHKAAGGGHVEVVKSLFRRVYQKFERRPFRCYRRTSPPVISWVAPALVHPVLVHPALVCLDVEPAARKQFLPQKRQALKQRQQSVIDDVKFGRS